MHQTTLNKSCLYCGTEANLCRSAHIVPRCLGTFKNQPTLSDSVCQKCDAEIGKCEDILAKCAPEALFKANLGIQGRHKNPSSPFRRKHAGHGPMELRIKNPGTNHEMLVESVGDGKNCKIIPHLEISDLSGNKQYVILNDPESLSANELRTLVFSTPIKKPAKIWPRMQTNEQVDMIFELLNQCGLFESETIAEDIQPFEGVVTATGHTTWDDRRFRAIAKIALHYYVFFNNFNHMGTEEIFSPIKDFIRYGKGELKTFVEEKRGFFVEQLKRGWRPPSYGHIIVATANTGRITVNIQLFVGPNYEPTYHEISLCRNPFEIDVPEITFGHNYAYSTNEPKLNYDGGFHELLVTRLRL